jgi:hypothetical protein
LRLTGGKGARALSAAKPMHWCIICTYFCICEASKAHDVLNKKGTQTKVGTYILIKVHRRIEKRKQKVQSLRYTPGIEEGTQRKGKRRFVCCLMSEM